MTMPVSCPQPHPYFVGSKLYRLTHVFLVQPETALAMYEPTVMLFFVLPVLVQCCCYSLMLIKMLPCTPGLRLSRLSRWRPGGLGAGRGCGGAPSSTSYGGVAC